MKKYIVIDDYGRTPNVCNIILKLIDDIPQIKEVSVLMNFVNISFHEKLKLTKIQTSLHLNLTDNIIFKNISNKNLTFIKLLFLKRNNRKYIFNEIDKQIENYTKIYNVRKIDINSHQHVHTIPWIYSYLLKNDYNDNNNSYTKDNHSITIDESHTSISINVTFNQEDKEDYDDNPF